MIPIVLNSDLNSRAVFSSLLQQPKENVHEISGLE